MSRYFSSFLAFWLPQADRVKTLQRMLDDAKMDRLAARIACAHAEATVEELEAELGIPSKPDPALGVEVAHLTTWQGVDTGRFPRG